MTRPAAWLSMAALLALGGVVRGQGGSPEGPPPALVRVGEVVEQEVQQRELVVGEVAATRRSTVAAEESGRVVQAPPDAGIAVSAGDVLAQLDDTLLKLERSTSSAALAEAEATVAAREAELRRAEHDLSYYESLVARDAATQKELSDAREDFAVAKAQLAQAQAAVERQQRELAEYDRRLQMMRITVPFDGVVIRKATELGQWLSPGEPAAELIELDRVDVMFDVPELLIGQIEVGCEMPVHVKSLGERRVGSVDRIVPQADPASRTFPVIVRLDNADGRLRPGMTAEAMAPASQTMQALTVPRDAVRVTPTGSLVYVDRAGTASPVNVRVLFGVGERFVVEAPLAAGDRVVVEGNERLTPGQPLQVMDEPEPASEAQAAATTPDAPAEQ